MIAGSYDFIEEYREEHGDEAVTMLLDAGYEPFYIDGEGWTWQPVSSTSVTRNSSTMPFTPVNLVVHVE